MWMAGCCPWIFCCFIYQIRVVWFESMVYNFLRTFAVHSYQEQDRMRQSRGPLACIGQGARMHRVASLPARYEDALLLVYPCSSRCAWFGRRCPTSFEYGTTAQAPQLGMVRALADLWRCGPVLSQAHESPATSTGTAWPPTLMSDDYAVQKNWLHWSDRLILSVSTCALSFAYLINLLVYDL
jgi:hypothetical protein